MCRSMVDIQSPTAEIRRAKKKRRRRRRRRNRMKIYMVSLLHRATIKNQSKNVLPKINRMQATPLTMHCNALHAADGTIPLLPGGDGSAQHVICPSDLDLWPWHSNSSKRGTTHIFPVNLVQIHSAVPKVFDSQTKKDKVTDSTKNRTLRSSLCMVTIPTNSPLIIV